MAPQQAVDIELPAYSANPELPKPAHISSASPPIHPSNPAPFIDASNNPLLQSSPSKRLCLAKHIAFVIGAAITAGTTYALVKRVQNLLANSYVDPSPATWSSAARTQVYDRCYLGCPDDCSNPRYAFNACQRTVSLPGNCDANKMWNWAERYPEACLAAMGDVLRDRALEGLRQSYRNQLAIIILTVLGGVVGGVIAYRLMKQCVVKRDLKAAQASLNPPAYRKKAPGAGKSRLKLLFGGFLTLFGREAQAYACTGHHQAADQFFVSPNGTIGGVVHGWFSNCYDLKLAFTNKAPAEFVRDAADRVEACGFRLVDSAAVDGSAGVRVANAKIERDYRVKIAVSGYNVTRSDETDEMVLCLHAIGG